MSPSGALQWGQVWSSLGFGWQQHQLHDWTCGKLQNKQLNWMPSDHLSKGRRDEGDKCQARIPTPFSRSATWQLASEQWGWVMPHLYSNPDSGSALFYSVVRFGTETVIGLFCLVTNPIPRALEAHHTLTGWLCPLWVWETNQTECMSTLLCLYISKCIREFHTISYH